MIKIFLTSIFICSSIFSFSQNIKKDSAVLKQISNHILTNYQCYKDLNYLCKQIGHRLTGSAQAEQAVTWGKTTLDKLGCDRVFLQEVMVPHWVRGDAQGYFITNGKKTSVNVLSIGNAVGSGENGITAPVLKINHIDELKRMSEQDVKGKIVFYNFKFDQTVINTFEGYGPCVYYRWGAPSEASKLGAIGVVIRSVSTAYDDKAHTGSIAYDKAYPSIPAVAISNVEADNLENLLSNNKKVSMFMRTTCQMLSDIKSYNVVAEIKGTELPNEIIMFGGHLDSWDVGEGAHDDGAGVVQSIEVLRVFKELGIKPKRTIRAVLFMNEENGLRGAKKYADLAEANHEKHIVAIESDAGGATPYGFSMEMEREKREKIKSWSALFAPYNIWSFDKEGGGADVGAMKRKLGTPVMELMPDSQQYFDLHHSDNDVFENVHRRELSLGAIAMSQMVYMISIHGL